MFTFFRYAFVGREHACKIMSVLPRTQLAFALVVIYPKTLKTNRAKGRCIGSLVNCASLQFWVPKIAHRIELRSASEFHQCIFGSMFTISEGAFVCSKRLVSTEMKQWHRMPGSLHF